jgi:TonB family protein
MRAFAVMAAFVPIVLGAGIACAQVGPDAPPALPEFSAPVMPGGNASPTLVRRVAPQYPPRSLQRHENGAVVVRFTIDVDGTTKNIEVLESSARHFEQPAVEALSKWVFVPQVQGGVPVELRGVETVICFTLSNGRGGKLPSEVQDATLRPRCAV